jgi:hypothetical protein
VPDPRSDYERRLAAARAALARGETADRRIANLRLAVAGVAALVAWLAFVHGSVSPAWLIPLPLAFLALVVAHARTLQQNERTGRSIHFYGRGLDRIDGRWSGSGPDGARFLEGHPYARDLDLFGPGSLFQLLDNARTEAGEETLAGWLSAPAAPDEIQGRQRAVAELSGLQDFREALAVLAAEAHVGRTGMLAEWAAAAPAGLPAWLGRAFAASAVVSVLLVTGGFLEWVGGGWVAGWLVVQTAFAFRWRRQVAEVIGRIDVPIHDLGLLSALIERIEREPFTSPLLAAMHERLTAGGEPPSRRISRLRRYVSALDATHNQLFRPVAPLMLVRSQAAVAIDRWHAGQRDALLDWLRIVGDIEALSSLAAHRYEHPADPFPVIADQGPFFKARGLAHPLLAEASAVRNDVALGAPAPQVLIVSGSNMSGKSTLLRAVGINVVLALAGGSVRAVALELTPLAIGATLRVEDSLQEGRSRFYAEILRIRDIVAGARGSLPLLFLLDEILHGTNSHDRRIGAEAIIRALVGAGAIGLVTTHDLALTAFAAAPGSRASNVHFEDRVEDGRMVFDYRMRDGVVERSNALALMRAIGLDV